MSQFVHLPYFFYLFLPVRGFFVSQSRVHIGFLGIVTYACRFTENNHVCLDFFIFLGRLSVAGWIWMIVESSLMLLEFVSPLYFWLETLFDFIFENVLVISFSIFCFEISALGLFFLSTLLGYCLWVVAKSEGGSVIFFLFYLI